MEKGCGAQQGRGHLVPQVNGDGFEDIRCTVGALRPLMPQAAQSRGEVRPLYPGGQALTWWRLIDPAGGAHPGGVSGQVTRGARRGKQPA